MVHGAFVDGVDEEVASGQFVAERWKSKTAVLTTDRDNRKR